jgi:DNA polymerase-3 subunit alpha
MVDDFIDRKHGKQVAYPDAQVPAPLAGTDSRAHLRRHPVSGTGDADRAGAGRLHLGGADMLRRAMGKKKAEEMAKQRVNLHGRRARQRRSTRRSCRLIFDLMEKFAGYGFNKSHSAAYALVSYQTAWLKRHYPAEFMAAVLSSEMHNTDKVVV